MSDAKSIHRTGERPGGGASGPLILLVLLGLIVLTIFGASNGDESRLAQLLAVTCLALFLMGTAGFYIVQPNTAAIITLFGDYRGSDRRPGLHWVPFWYGRRKISLRVRNVTSETLKINDKRGNPIEIAANVVWHVADSAQAMFDVDDYKAFIAIQIETALREVSRHYAYDNSENDEPTLRDDAEAVSERLREDLQARISVAGIAIDECHLMHLAYAPEIAGAMLRRQQAEAVIAARQKIVTGAVSMVETALAQLSERSVVELDEERKAAMVSNLLVVLCADRDAQPVINTGSLYG